MSGLSNFVYNPHEQYLFNRSYSLSLGEPGQTAAVQYGNIGPNPGPLRVRFDINKTSLGSSNKSKIEIYNLSTLSRQKLKKGWIIQLQAGYNNLVRTLFIGNVLPTGLISTRNGADIITAMECGDGESSIIFARLDKSYPAGITLAEILQDVAQQMSIATTYNPAGINAGIAVGIPKVVYNKGFVASGACKDTLDKLLKPQGMEWSIQNGDLNILPIGGTTGDVAQVVSMNTGLIGVPSNGDGFVQFTNLLNPKYVPGTLIQLISENTALNGYYKIRNSHFEGDSHDTKWQVSCECVPIPGTVQILPVAQGFNYNTAVT